MSREVVIQVWCDACPDDAKTPGTSYALAVGKRSEPRAVDLCDAHAAELYHPIVNLLTEHGYALNGDAPTVAPTKYKSPSQTERVPCPACPDNPGQIRSALPNHIYKVHLKSKVPLHKQCPECGWRPPRSTAKEGMPRAVGSHRRTQHGVSLLDDALKALDSAET